MYIVANECPGVDVVQLPSYNWRIARTF